MENDWCYIVMENGRIVELYVGSFYTLIEKINYDTFPDEMDMPIGELQKLNEFSWDHHNKTFHMINTSKTNIASSPPQIMPCDEVKDNEDGYVVRYREVFYKDFWVSKHGTDHNYAKQRLQDYLDQKGSKSIASEFEYVMPASSWAIIATPYRENNNLPPF